jgi:hypothetical protein
VQPTVAHVSFGLYSVEAAGGRRLVVFQGRQCMKKQLGSIGAVASSGSIRYHQVIRRGGKRQGKRGKKKQLYSGFAVTFFYIYLPVCPMSSICISFHRKIVTVPCSSKLL